MHDLHTIQAYFELMFKISPKTFDHWVDNFWSKFSHKGGIA